MATTPCIPAPPVPPAVPTILAAPFLAAVLRPRAGPVPVAVPRPAVRVGLASWLVLDVSVAVPVPGTAAWPAFAVPVPRWPCCWIPAVAAAVVALPPMAPSPVAALSEAGLVALSNSPLLTKPVTPWAPSGPVMVCALTERLGLESPPIV